MNCSIDASLPILVLDDDAFTRKLLLRMLSGLGYDRVVACATVPEALAVIDDGATMIDLVLLDLSMPDVDGVEFVRSLGDRGYSGALIVMSGAEPRIVQTAETLIKTRGMRACGHLDKPLRPAQLKELVGAWGRKGTLAQCQAPQRYTAAALAEAIEQQALVNYYQPQIDVKSGAVVGAEALVRWQHPTDGVVGPDQFISLAEESGLIDSLTNHVFASALAHTRAWHASGTMLQISINVSMDSLSTLKFPDTLFAAVSNARLAPKDITLEITESRLAKDRAACLDILTRLGLRQIGLSIDDFGTGHSSLAQLRDLPFNELKLDRSFVHGASRNSTLRAICDASLRMARDLGMTCVAEGVEDKDDWDFVRASSCNLAQGYYFAKPMTVADFNLWLWTRLHGPQLPAVVNA